VPFGDRHFVASAEAAKVPVEEGRRRVSLLVRLGYSSSDLRAQKIKKCAYVVLQRSGRCTDPLRMSGSTVAIA
jgi:hypothetical protein